MKCLLEKLMNLIISKELSILSLGLWKEPWSQAPVYFKAEVLVGTKLSHRLVGKICVLHGPFSFTYQQQLLLFRPALASHTCPSFKVSIYGLLSIINDCLHQGFACLLWILEYHFPVLLGHWGLALAGHRKCTRLDSEKTNLAFIVRLFLHFAYYLIRVGC